VNSIAPLTAGSSTDLNRAVLYSTGFVFTHGKLIVVFTQDKFMKLFGT